MNKNIMNDKMDKVKMPTKPAPKKWDQLTVEEKKARNPSRYEEEKPKVAQQQRSRRNYS
jgi:hypothetical protein